MTRFLPPFLRSRLKEGSDLRLAANTGWQLADQVVRMAVSLATGIWIARYLGPEQYGVLSYALAFVGMFSALSSLGLDDILVREVVRAPQEKDRILGTGFLLKLLGAGTAFLAAVAGIFLLRPADTQSHLLVAVIALGGVFQSSSVIEYWFHSRVQAKYAVFGKGTGFLVASVLKVLLILLEAPVAAFAAVAAAEVALGSLGLLVAYRAAGNSVRAWKTSVQSAKKLLRDSWPLMASGMVIMIYFRIDQVMLGEMAGDREVGIYSVAVRMAEVWCFIPTAVYWSLFPGIVEAKGISEELFYQRLQRLYNTVALAAYAVALPVTLLAEWLVPLLFGEEYRRASLMLAVLVWANLFTSLEIARSSFLTAMNWTRLYLVTASLGCGLNIVLNYLLIPLYGGMGAVIASLAAYWFAAHGSCFLFRPLHRTGRMLTRAMLFPRVGQP